MSLLRSARAAAAALLLVFATCTVVAGAGTPGLSSGLTAGAAKSAEIRVALGRSLGEHAFLLMALMRAEAAEAPERNAVRAAVDDNSVELAGAVASVYGDAAGEAFLARWAEHIDLLVEYARAVAARDMSKAESISTATGAAHDRLAALLIKVNPELDATRGKASLALHMNQMRQFADEDHVAVYAAEREAYAHMFRFGDDFAKAIIKQYPNRFADARVIFSPAADLRIRLDRLLGEHLLLAGEAMRTGLVDSPASEPARSALDANTEDLVASISLVYGADAGSAFGDLWRAHIDAYLEYIDAVQANDDAEKQRVLGVLRAYGTQLGDFIASANDQLPADAVADLVHHHVVALIGQVNAFAAEDYPRAFSTMREAYGHLFTVGDRLAAAIAAQFPDRFADIAALPATATELPTLLGGGIRWGIFAVTALLALVLARVLWCRRMRLFSVRR